MTALTRNNFFIRCFAAPRTTVGPFSAVGPFSGEFYELFFFFPDRFRTTVFVPSRKRLTELVFFSIVALVLFKYQIPR